MSTALFDDLDLRYPLIQAPMVGVSTPALAAAVSEAGALGSLGLGGSDAQQTERAILELRTRTDRPFNLNLFCHVPAQPKADVEARWLQQLAPAFSACGAQPPASLSLPYRSFLEQPECLEVLLQLRPAVLSFHFGLPPQDWIDRLRGAGVRLLGCATSLSEAEAIATAQLDAVIAQGWEAGGHRGVFDPSDDRRLGTLALVRLLAERVRLPLIAAGGLMDGGAIRAALQAGANAVQLGTAFIGCPESAASDAYRAALTGPRAEATQVSAAISGRPARGLPNRLFDALAGCEGACPDYPIAYSAAKALAAAGGGDYAVQWAGQGAPLARQLPASELVQQLAREVGWQA